MSENNNIMSMCANCGKGEEESHKLKTCTACKMVKYCSAVCQKAHRPMHKKACKKRAAELYDEQLFKEIELDDCPLCFLPMPYGDQTTFMSCCGKRICDGCIYAVENSGGRSDLCAFCRIPATNTSIEYTAQVKKLMKKGNGEAHIKLASDYADGNVVAQDWNRAHELYLKAGELGCATGYFNMGNCYNTERGVERDLKKAKHYWELAAMKGHVVARHNLAVIEDTAGNRHRAYKHFVLAAKAGNKDSLDEVRQGFMKGRISKEEYANSLRSYQNTQNEMKSDTRDKAAEIRERFGGGA